jgi:hypothetical protein
MRMVTPRLLIATCAVALVAGSLAACTPSAPTPTRTPIATHSQAFASDADALKAATEAYAAYLKMSDTIAQEGGANPERFAEVADGKALDDALSGVAEYVKKGLHITGSTTFDSVTLQSKSENSSVIYVCDDVSTIDVVTTSGQSVVMPDRKPRTPFVVTVEVGANPIPTVMDRTLWEGDSYC